MLTSVAQGDILRFVVEAAPRQHNSCLLYTSDAADEL